MIWSRSGNIGESKHEIVFEKNAVFSSCEKNGDNVDGVWYGNIYTPICSEVESVRQDK